MAKKKVVKEPPAEVADYAEEPVLIQVTVPRALYDQSQAKARRLRKSLSSFVRAYLIWWNGVEVSNEPPKDWAMSPSESKAILKMRGAFDKEEE